MLKAVEFVKKLISSLSYQEEVPEKGTKLVFTPVEVSKILFDHASRLHPELPDYAVTYFSIDPTTMEITLYVKEKEEETHGESDTEDASSDKA